MDSLIAQLATRQHGVVTTRQLLSLGLTCSMVSRRADRGALHRVHRGVYAVGHRRLSREGQWMAAVLASGDGAVLSHLSAAVLWNSWRRKVATIHLLARHARARSGVTVHRARRLDPRDRTVRTGIPVTTLARTLVDLSELLTKHQLANVIHEAAFRTHFDAGQTRHAIGRANGRHRLEPLEAAIALHESGSAGTRSDPEDRFLTHIQASGVPEPLVNTRVAGIEVD